MKISAKGGPGFTFSLPVGGGGLPLAPVSYATAGAMNSIPPNKYVHLSSKRDLLKESGPWAKLIAHPCNR